MRRLAALLIALAIIGCASQQTPKTATAGEQAVKLRLANAGWDEVDKNGRTMYCSNVASTGSHIAPGCLTASELDKWLLEHWARGSGVSTAANPGVVPSASIYTSFNASGH